MLIVRSLVPCIFEAVIHHGLEGALGEYDESAERNGHG